MDTVFSLRKHFGAKILIFDKASLKIITDEQIESSIDFSEASIKQKTSHQTLSKINALAQKCFLTEYTKCIILAM